MVRGFTNNCIKLSLFGACSLLCICGLLVAGGCLFVNLGGSDNSAWAKLADEAKEYDLGDLAKLRTAVWCLMALGWFTFLVGFLGCCGACFELRPVLALFAAVAALALLALLAAGVAAIVLYNEDQLNDVVRRALQKDGQVLREIEEIYKNQCTDAATCADLMVESLVDKKWAVVATWALLLLVTAVTVAFSALHYAAIGRGI